MIIFSYYLIKVIFALGFFYSAYKFIKTDFLINYYLIFLLVFAALVLILFLIKTYFKKFLTSILPILYAIIFAIYTFEFFMFFNLSSVKLINHIPLNVLAKEKNLEWDNRSSFEFYEILKDKNPNTYPNYSPSLLLSEGIFDGLKIDDKYIFPLSGISNSTTYLGNEVGYYPVFQNDQFGFKNKNQDYKHKVDFVLIGDSFIEGCCVKQNNSIQGNLIKSGLNVLSFGKNGAGPLTEYAIVREYLNNNLINFSNLIWFFYENDFEDLEKELNSKILYRYLSDKDFTQSLINKQNIIDEVLIDYIDSKILNMQIEDKDDIDNILISNHKYQKFNFINFFKLSYTRNLFQLMPKDKNTRYFNNILYESKKITERKNANFYFVYIPSSRSFSHNYKYQFKKPVLDTVESLDIQIIDLTDLILSLDDPLSIWPFNCCGHFNEQGYALITSFIIHEIFN